MAPLLQPARGVGERHEIAEDLRFQRRMWIAQRVGWAAMALVVLAALAGLFGPGPLSAAVAGDAEGRLSVDYHRFARSRAPETLRVQWGADLADSGGRVRLWIDKRYLESHQLRHVLPPPEAVEVGEGRLTYEFAVEDPARRGSATFTLTADRIGPAEVRLGIEGGPTVELWQLVYP